MDEKQYREWWELHRRVVNGEPLSPDETRIYEAGCIALDAEEWAGWPKASAQLRPLQQRLRELMSQNQYLAQQELALRQQASQLEKHYLALTGEPLGLEV